MSNKQHTKAVLVDTKGPFFPESLVVLQPLYSLWATRNYNALILGTVATRLRPDAPVSAKPSFELLRPSYHAKTSDKYRWIAALDFKAVRNGFNLGRITLLLPHCTDAHLIDGTYTDRSIAVHSTGMHIDDAIRHEFVKRFHDALYVTTQLAAA